MNLICRTLTMALSLHALVPILFAQQEVGVEIRLPITLEGDQRTELHARVEGYIAQVHVDIGDRVRKGDLLVTLDAPELEAELRRREQMLMQAQAELGVAKGKIAVAEARLIQTDASRKEQAAMKQLRVSERDRYAVLVQGGAVQREKLEEAEYGVMAVDAAIARIDANEAAARADVSAANSEFAFAQSGIQVAKAEMESASTQDSLRQIIAPFDGLITARDVDDGQLVSPGTLSNAPLLVIEHVDVLRGVMTIPADQADRVRVGDQVTLIKFSGGDKAKSRDGETLSVSRIGQSLNQKTRTMRVEIDIKNPFDQSKGRYQFLSGQYGLATLKTKN